ncbi:MAG: hypothetical protein A2V70_17680 [Planctomycetes bacterium RBG_13_63_9]|nr:MAG: hypothetical protein A2V70_17680 [Planctomycetes bacterium RBG_13_63_9]
MDEYSQGWKDFFGNWPGDMPRRGVLVTSFDEQILFTGFLTSASFLLIERRAPDSVGGRMVMLPYDKISALKVTEVVKLKAFRAIGFEGALTHE